MKKNRWTRAEKIWAGVVVLVLLLTLWWIPGEDSEGRDTHSTGLQGKKAFFDLVNGLHSHVWRHEQGSSPPVNASNFCILGPSRVPDGEQFEVLYDWVAAGHSLIFAPQRESPELSLFPFPVRIVSDSGDQLEEEEEKGEEEEEEEKESPAEDDEKNADPAWSSLTDMFRSNAETSLVTGDFSWKSSGHLHLEGPAEVLVSRDKRPQAAVMKIGKGRLLVLSTDSPFTNWAMTKDDTSILAYRVLEAGLLRGSIVFDETKSNQGPRLLRTLFLPLFRPLTLQVLLLATLFGWMGCRTFGPHSTESTERRRNIVEHAIALGNLYYKSKSGHRSIEASLERLRRRMPPGVPRSFTDRGAHAIARIADRDPKEVKSLLETAIRLSEDKSVSAPQTGRLVRSLARLGRRLKKRKGSESHGT